MATEAPKIADKRHPGVALLTMEQLEVYVGLDKRTIHRLVSAGQFPPSVDLPVRCARWSRRQIDEWIDSRTVNEWEE